MQDSPLIRPIRSFIRRQGRITPAQSDALERLWNNLGLNLEDGPIDPQHTFTPSAPLVLEIGFGNGESLAQMADHRRDMNFIGIEVHRPGVGHLMLELERRELSNVRIYSDDAIDVIKKAIPVNSLSRVNLFFPDPWHKKRHHKRRIVNQEFMTLILKRLQPEGLIHFATDWENYAEHMLQVLESRPELYNCNEHGGYSPRPTDRPETKFERRGLRLGHSIFDLLFRKKL